METTRYVEANFNGKRSTTTRRLYQYDYGQILTFPDLTTPPAYQVQFCALGDAATIEMIGSAEGVAVPDELLQRGRMITAFVFLHDTLTDGETRYVVAIPVTARPEMADVEPTPEEIRLIDQLIAALNAGVTRSEAAADEAEGSAAEAAESASGAAQSATEAQTAAQSAIVAADMAGESSENAAINASRAAASATAAAQSATAAATDADRAEQAAAQSGYLYFYIENGLLYMERTPNTEVDFYIEDGNLYVEAA